MRPLLHAFFALSLLVALWSTAGLFAEGRTLFWREVPATITKSEMKVILSARSATKMAQDTDTNWYTWDFEYTYNVDGLVFQSYQRSLLDNAVWSKHSLDAMAARYPVNAVVPAYVSPDDPARAVLEPGFRFLSVLISLSSVLGAIGTLWMLRGIKVNQRWR